MAHIRQSTPDFGLSFQVQVVKPFAWNRSIRWRESYGEYGVTGFVGKGEGAEREIARKRERERGDQAQTVVVGEVKVFEPFARKQSFATFFRVRLVALGGHAARGREIQNKSFT